MKKAIYLSIFLFALLLNGCSNDSDDKALNFSESDIQMKFIVNSYEKNTVAQWTMQYTGRNISRFDKTTGEIKFQDAPESSAMIAQTLKSTDRIDFYLGDEFLFSAKIRSDLSSSFYNDVVLYYDLTQEKYYIKDGYPPFKNKEKDKYPAEQEKRDENWEKISAGYQKMIDQLRKENRIK